MLDCCFDRHTYFYDGPVALPIWDGVARCYLELIVAQP
jgi:hypothetical protein